MFVPKALGDPASDLQDRVTFLSQQLSAIGVAAQQAKARGDQADLVAIMAQYRNVAGQINILNSQIPSGMPSDFMLSLSNLSDQLVQVGQEGFNLTAETARGLASSVNILPLLLVGIVAVLGIGLYKGSLSASVRR